MFIAVATAGTSFANARAYCQANFESDLASVHSAAEARIVRQACTSVQNSSGAACFIGLHDAKGDGQWSWSDNSTADWVVAQQTNSASHPEPRWAGIDALPIATAPLTWTSGRTDEPVQTFVCGDAREALHMVESHISLPPMALGGSVTVSAWVREGSPTLRGLWFSSYESAACGDTDACRQASGGSLDSHGWLAIGHGRAAGHLYVPETVFPSAMSDKFWIQAQHQWLHVSVVVSWTTVSLFSNGVLQSVGTREAPLPNILRRENTHLVDLRQWIKLRRVLPTCGYTTEACPRPKRRHCSQHQLANAASMPVCA